MLWSDLGGDDARKAYRAIRSLAYRPKEAASFLAEKMRPLAILEKFDDDPDRVAKLIADLDARVFATREKATKELQRLGKRIEPALRKALDESLVLEVRKRLEELLK